MGKLFGSLLGFASDAFGGVWGYVIALGFGALLATGATYYIVHTANAVEIGDLKLAAKTKEAADTSATLGQLQGFIDHMHMADMEYNNTLNAINDRFATLSKDWKHATLIPLPRDCFPPPDRLRAVNAAIKAANAASPSP